jgi:hypothetical protein
MKISSQGALFMKKLKEILQGIAFYLLGSDHDHGQHHRSTCLQKELDERQKKKTRHPDYSIELIKTVEH